MSLEQIFDYFRTYDSATYEVAACGAARVSEADLEAFEDEFGVRPILRARR